MKVTDAYKNDRIIWSTIYYSVIVQNLKIVTKKNTLTTCSDQSYFLIDRLSKQPIIHMLFYAIIFGGWNFVYVLFDVTELLYTLFL